MSKIVIQTKRGKTLLTNRLSYPETVNEWVYNAITAGEFEGVLPLTVEKKRKETRILCCVQGLMPLNEYFADTVTEQMFLELACQIVAIMRSCEKNMVSANNLDLQRDRIFVDPFTKTLKCVYWPVVNNQNSAPPQQFLKQLPYDVSFDGSEDSAYLEQYAAFFNGSNLFSLNGFERLLLTLLGRESADHVRLPFEPWTGASQERKESRPDAESKTGIEYDPLSDLRGPARTETEKRKEPETVFCGFCGTGNPVKANFCLHCGRELRAGNEMLWIPNDRTESAYGSEEGTAVLKPGQTPAGAQPMIKRSATGECHVVNKTVLRIGSGAACCDYVIGDNAFISRIHADILARNGQYFIVDRNSTNKTFIGGKALLPDTETELKDGTVFQLADETFVFSLQ